MRVAAQGGCRRSESGQASVEYLLVGLVFIAMIVAVAALWRFVAEGGMSALVQDSTSHALTTQGGLLDVFWF